MSSAAASHGRAPSTTCCGKVEGGDASTTSAPCWRQLSSVSLGGPATIAVLLRIGKDRHSLAVDAVLGVRQVLVRQIESRRCGALVAGGAVMGDGKVAVVLDPDRLLTG